MALTLGDNFSYQGAKPLDARLTYSTVAAMKAVADATMYEGCLAYCSGTDKTYQWKSTNTVDETLGKWREFQAGGGGGGTSYTAGDGIDITNDEISTEKSQNGWMDEVIEKVPMAGPLINIANAFNNGDLYSTTERMIGQWVDGKPLYQKTVSIGALPNATTKTVAHGISNIDYVVEIKATAKRNNASMQLPIPHTQVETTNTQIRIDATPTNIEVITGHNFIDWTGYATLKYTKATDSAVSIGEANDYSTSEKIIGTWVDGSPIYQRTYDLVTDFVVGYDTTWTMTSINSSDIDKVIDCLATNSTGTFFPMMAYADRTQNVIGLTACRYGRTATVRHLTIQYTKLT